MKELFYHMFSMPTWWQLLELLWILLLAGYGYKKHLEEVRWFAEPVTAGSMFWDLAVAAGLTTWLTTEFQLEGLFVVMKYHFFKEVLKHNRGLKYLLMLVLSSLIFLALVVA